MKISRYMMAVGLLFVSVSIQAQNNDRDCIRMGNKYFRSGEYSKAETYYRKALEMNKSLEAFYNLGNSIATQGVDSIAYEQFKNALGQKAETSEKKAWVYHNMGNMMYLNGRNMMKANRPDAMNSFQHAVEMFKSALRCNPDDHETRYNLAMAQYMLKKNQENQGNQDQENGQDKKDQEGDNKDQKEKQDKHKDKENQQDKEQQNQDQQDKDKNQQEQQQQQQDKPEEGDMDDKTAEQLLNSAQQDEKAVQRKVQQAEKSHRKGLEKDW